MYLEPLPKDVEFEAVSVDSFHAIKSHVESDVANVDGSNQNLPIGKILKSQLGRILVWPRKIWAFLN